MSDLFSHDYPDTWSTAFALVQRNFRVIPINFADASGICSCQRWRDEKGLGPCENPGRHPPFKYAVATRSAWAVNGWGEIGVRGLPFNRYNLAVITGWWSQAFVVDIDGKNGGIETWDELVYRYGHPPSTLEVITPSSVDDLKHCPEAELSRHLYFRWPGWDVTCGIDRIGRGVDVKGERGLAMVPPSRRNGVPYEWGGIDGFRADVAPAPAWLLSLLAATKPPNRSQGSVYQARSSPLIAQSNVDADGKVRHPHRYPYLFTLACWMRNNKGANAEQIYERLLAKNRNAVSRRRRRAFSTKSPMTLRRDTHIRIHEGVTNHRLKAVATITGCKPRSGRRPAS